ncbi:hypothetical protein ITJ66_16735 [Plantibacter sp. VKM Ac-2885]|uniref:hypothetical protein n=1 Tax=Plantibacter sp. VKM Ac-2885 TaxID=2783828 RepID=UPI00188C56BB|nr:hypothetical protein [Plantibacter sp. VKM Ac-2885]MBF4514134.1 hypothetical protein [Plantibacter sp. VKM Ac-2885]
MRYPVVALLTVTTALLASTLTGCTNPDTPTASKTPSPSSTPMFSAEGLPPGTVGDPDVPSDVPNDPDLRKHVTAGSCTSTDDGWSMSGAIENPGKKTAEYTLTVFFATSGATVLATADTVVKVEAGETKSWRADATFSAPPETRCVLRGVAER